MAAMKTSELRILFVVDAIQGRNGVGTYFQDLVANLEQEVERAELVAPSMDDPKPYQGLALPIPGDPTQKLYIPKLRVLTRIFLEVNPHVVVLPGPGIYSLAGFWLAGKLGIPVCVTYQTDYRQLARLYFKGHVGRTVGRMMEWLNRAMFRRAQSVVTVSNHMLELAAASGVRGARLVGTPIARNFLDRPPVPPGHQLRSVLYVGRLAAEKNIESFIELARERPDLNFHVAGDGPLRRTVENAGHELGNLHYLGWLPRAGIIDLLDRADALILPSSIEAFGTVALEAMARQRLVLTSPHCGINQWPDLGQALFAVQQGERLADTLRRVEALPVAERQAIAAQARHAAISVNGGAVTQWLDVLVQTSRNRRRLSNRRPSGTVALLRRLDGPQ